MNPIDTLRYADSLLLAAHQAAALDRREILHVVALLSVLLVVLVVLVLVLLHRQRRADVRTQALLASLERRAAAAELAEQQAAQREARAFDQAEQERARAAALGVHIDTLNRLTRAPIDQLLPPAVPTDDRR